MRVTQPVKFLKQCRYVLGLPGWTVNIRAERRHSVPTATDSASLWIAATTGIQFLLTTKARTRVSKARLNFLRRLFAAKPRFSRRRRRPLGKIFAAGGRLSQRLRGLYYCCSVFIGRFVLSVRCPIGYLTLRHLNLFLMMLLMMMMKWHYSMVIDLPCIVSVRLCYTGWHCEFLYHSLYKNLRADPVRFLPNACRKTRAW